MASVLSQAHVSSPAASFSQLLLSQDIDQLQPLSNITREDCDRQNQDDPPKKVKRTRLLLDARTELTDDELKVFTPPNAKPIVTDTKIDCSREIRRIPEPAPERDTEQKTRERQRENYRRPNLGCAKRK
jgi:hypothetical protein